MPTFNCRNFKIWKGWNSTLNTCLPSSWIYNWYLFLCLFCFLSIFIYALFCLFEYLSSQLTSPWHFTPKYFNVQLFKNTDIPSNHIITPKKSYRNLAISFLTSFLKNQRSLKFFFSVVERRYSTYNLVQFSSVAQSCSTLCDLMNCSTPGLPVQHQLPEFTQTHVHRVSDTIQPSHPLSSPSPPAPNPSQHQGLF